MDAPSVAAVIFTVVAAVAVGFQLALAAGAPWGTYAMGGRFPGRFPAPMRIAALVQGVVLALLAGAVLGAAAGGVSLKRIWVVVIVAVTASIVVTIVLQSLGFAPAMRLA